TQSLEWVMPCSAEIDSVPPLQAGGHRFDPGTLHGSTKPILAIRERPARGTPPPTLIAFEPPGAERASGVTAAHACRASCPHPLRDDQASGVSSRCGVLVFAGASALCGLTPKGSFAEAWLVAFRAVQGLGGAIMFPAALAIVVQTFALHERG